MTLKSYPNWRAFADEVAAAVTKKQAGLIRARQRAIAGLADTYARVHHRADLMTWQDAVGIFLDFAHANDRAAFTDLARNYGVLDVEIDRLWLDTRKALGRAR